MIKAVKYSSRFSLSRRVSARLSPCHRNGLTIIELMVAIGILTLTVSLGAFFLKNQLPKLRLYAAAHDLAAALDRARRLTVSQQIPHGVNFILAGNAYRLVKFAPAPVTISTSTLPQAVSFYSTTTPFTGDTVRFNASGGADESGEIMVQTDSDEKKIIRVNPSGYVQAQ